MLNPSVLIFLMLRALYRMICKNVKSFFGENNLNVTNVKLFSKLFFDNLGVFLMVFWFCSLTYRKIVNFWWFVTFYYLKKAHKSHFEPIYLVILVWFTYHLVGGAQHQKNKKLWIRHKSVYLMKLQDITLRGNKLCKFTETLTNFC